MFFTESLSNLFANRQYSYSPTALWLGCWKTRKILKAARLLSSKIPCRLEGYLFRRKKEELVELSEKAHELNLELTGDCESDQSAMLSNNAT